MDVRDVRVEKLRTSELTEGRSACWADEVYELQSRRDIGRETMPTRRHKHSHAHGHMDSGALDTQDKTQENTGGITVAEASGERR